MYEDLLERIESELLDNLGYKITPDEAASVAARLIDVVKEVLDERLTY